MSMLTKTQIEEARDEVLAEEQSRTNGEAATDVEQGAAGPALLPRQVRLSGAHAHSALQAVRFGPERWWGYARRSARWVQWHAV